MATWSWDENVVSLKEVFIKPSNRQTSPAGWSMARPRATTNKRTFILQMNYFSYAEKNAIRDFFDANQGIVFTLNTQDPNDGSETYDVIFDQDSLEFIYQKVYPGEYSLDLRVKEV